MFYGSLKSDNPQRSLQKQNEFFDQFESLPFDDRAAEFSARIRADLSKTGNLIGAYLIQIASISLANDLTLVTHNISEFSRVNGLKIEDWEA